MRRFLLILALWLPTSASAQGEVIDHQDALAVVPYRSVQMDVASSYTWDQPDQLDAGLLAHVGLGSGWEARVGVPPHARIPLPNGHASGFGDPTLGLKAELGDAMGWTFAATGDASLPIGGSRGGTHVITVATLTAGRDLPASLALETVAELAMDTGAPTPTAAFGLVLSSRVLRQLDVSLDVTTRIESLEVASVVIQNGYAVLLSPTVQFNVLLGVGIEGSDAPESLVGLGGSVRL
ncbi:MAG: hypothetical protein Rubg2KO_29300 [Rubricoccaceae bacterium]